MKNDQKNLQFMHKLLTQIEKTLDKKGSLSEEDYSGIKAHLICESYDTGTGIDKGLLPSLQMVEPVTSAS